MSKEIYEFEISRNAEGSLLATAGVKGEGASYRIAGPKAWGGSKKLASIEISQRDMVEFIRCYAPGALADLAAPSAANGAELPELPEPLEIDWPTLNRNALGCGVEDRAIHCRYNAAEYGWENGVDRAIESVPDAIYDADQMQAYARAAVLAERACINQLCEEEAARWQYPSHGNAAVKMLQSLIRART